MAKLKVFGWSDGLRSYAVATTSRAKALAAWGVRQDLFKEGVAREIDDPGLVKAALAQPGVALSEPASGGAIKALAAARPAAKPKGPSKAEREVARLRGAIGALELAHDQALERLADERRALQAKEAALVEAFEGERATLAARLAKARDSL
jgi:hypothetical protein